MNNKVIGARVRKLREKRNMAMKDLSELVNLSQPQISRLESGRQGFRSATLSRIASALRVDEAYLLQDWAPDGSIKKLRLDADLLTALHDPDFFLLARALARSRGSGSPLFPVCLALVDLLGNAGKAR